MGDMAVTHVPRPCYLSTNGTKSKLFTSQSDCETERVYRGAVFNPFFSPKNSLSLEIGNQNLIYYCKYTTNIDIFSLSCTATPFVSLI